MVPRLLPVSLAALLALSHAQAADWRADVIPAPGRASEVDLTGSDVRVAVGRSWYKITGDPARLEGASAPARVTVPEDALPDASVGVGQETVARAWLAEPTRRYDHGVLGDAIEAGSLVVEHHDGKREVLRLSADAVFEDITPRIVKLDGLERIILVKSYLDRGSALAVIDPRSARIIAETPPIGRPHAWLNPAGVADFDGDGVAEIALVRQPHVLGRLELWAWQDGKLTKKIEIGDVANHFIGSRALGMSFVADFDGDGRPDLAVPSLDRRALRLVSFVPRPHDIARVLLPARIATNIGAVLIRGRRALIAGLDNGQLVLVHDTP